MSNDTEKPNLEKDHKEFLKMKEQQINNKDEFVSDNDPIGKEMKKSGEKPDRESIKKDGAQENFSNREGFAGMGKKKKGPKGKQRAWVPIVVFIGTFFAFGFVTYTSATFLSLLRGFKEDRMAPSLDRTKTPYTKLGARPDDLAYEEALWSQKRHGFPYSWYDKDYPNSVFSIFSRMNINTWVGARDWTDKAFEVVRNFSVHDVPPKYVAEEKAETGAAWWFNTQEFLNIYIWTPILFFTTLVIGLTVGPIAVAVKGFFKTAYLYDNFPWLDMKTFFFGNIFLFLCIPFYTFLMPLYLLWFALIRPFSSIHASGNADWIQHLLQKFYIPIFSFACLACMAAIYGEFKNTEKVKWAVIPGFLTVFFILSALLKVIPWTMPIRKNGVEWNFSPPPLSKLNSLLYSAKSTEPAVKDVYRDMLHNFFWYLKPFGVFGFLKDNVDIGPGRETHNPAFKRSSKSRTGGLAGSLAKTAFKTAIKSTPQGRLAMMAAKKAAKMAKK
jgi:hypothetical protein